MPDRRYISSSDKGKRPLLDIREPPLSNAREQGRRDLRSSYPPMSPRSRETVHRTHGWEPNVFGDYPPNPQRSSMHSHRTSGYDATRTTPFPSSSRMGREYENYKGYTTRAIQESTERNRQKRELGGQFNTNRISPEVHRELYDQADSIKNLRESEGRSREKFFKDHIGRRDEHFIRGHAEQAENQMRSMRNMKDQKLTHRRYFN